MDRLSAALLDHFDQLLDVEVALSSGARAQQVSLVGCLNVERVAVQLERSLIVCVELADAQLVGDKLAQFLEENPATGRRIIEKAVLAARAAAVSGRLAAARTQALTGATAAARTASVEAMRARMQASRAGGDTLARSQAAIRIQSSRAEGDTLAKPQAAIRIQSNRAEGDTLARPQAAIRIQSSPTAQAAVIQQANPPPAALRDFGNAVVDKVVDKVGAQNPLLAESKVVPREPERDALLPPPSEMTQSFDSVPSLRSSSTKQKVRHSKSVTLQEETMEAVNFLNLISLRILP